MKYEATSQTRKMGINLKYARHQPNQEDKHDDRPANPCVHLRSVAVRQ